MRYLKGKVITFEGGEGAGKTTIINMLKQKLEETYQTEVCTFREPGGSKISESIRKVILDKKNTQMFGMTEAMLFAASRYQLLHETVLPLVEQGKIIIYDRFVDSSYVYQGCVRGIGLQKIIDLNQFVIDDFKIDRTYLLDLNPKIGLARIHNNNRETNRLDDENLDFHYNVRKYYLELAKKFSERIKVINADNASIEILNNIMEDVKTWM